MKSISKIAMTFAAAATLATGTAVPRPAMAQSQGMINTLIGVGAIVLYNNYVHKRQAANTIVGYTANGGTVYGDGRIVMPNGQVVYVNSSGYYPWGQPVYYSTAAVPSAYQYDYDRTGEYDRTGHHGRGHAYGHYKHHGNGEAEGHEH